MGPAGRRQVYGLPGDSHLAQLAGLKVVGGRDRVVVKFARVRLATDPSPLAQDGNLNPMMPVRQAGVDRG